MSDWWEIRPARNLKPATYRCPLCRGLLPALSDHMLLKPEGDSARRRHAHTACVLAARRAGRLPSRAEWAARQRATGAADAGDAGGRRSIAARIGAAFNSLRPRWRKT